MQINGHDLTLDLMDMETAARYEAAVLHYKEVSAAKIEEAKTLTETIRACGDGTYAMIDAIWEEGTAKGVLGETYHMTACLEAINAIFEEEHRQARGLTQWTEKFSRAMSR